MDLPDPLRNSSAHSTDIHPDAPLLADGMVEIRPVWKVVRPGVEPPAVVRVPDVPGDDGYTMLAEPVTCEGSDPVPGSAPVHPSKQTSANTIACRNQTRSSSRMCWLHRDTA